MKDSFPWAEAWREEVKSLFKKSNSFSGALAGLIRLEGEFAPKVSEKLGDPLYQGLILSLLEAIREEKEFPELVRRRLKFAEANLPQARPAAAMGLHETKNVGAYCNTPLLAGAEADFDPLGLPFKEAIDWFQKKKVTSPERFKTLDFKARSRAFSVAKLQNKYVLEGIKDEIASALKDGKTFLDFKDAVDDLFDSYGLDRKNPWHLETVFQNNIQSAYNAGRLEQMEAQKDTRPFWQYVTIGFPSVRPGDGGVRPGHWQWDSKVFPADHPFWQVGYPPNGHKCRCTVVSLSRDEMETEGLEEFQGNWQNPQYAFPDKGFVGKPIV